MIITCFECGKYCPIKDTGRHGNALSCDHKTYGYGRVKDSVHGDMEEVRPELKNFDASAVPVRDFIYFPLDRIEDIRDVDVGDELEPENFLDRVDHRVPDTIEVTGIVRHWDRVIIHYGGEEA